MNIHTAQLNRVTAGATAFSFTRVSNGLFTVLLDIGANAFAGPSRWLERLERPLNSMIGGAQ